MEEEPSLVTTTLTAADEGEYSLRPKTLKEYICLLYTSRCV